MPSSTHRSKITVAQIAIFAVLGCTMFVSRMVMASLPNIHLLGLFIGAATIVYKKRALFPIYVFVFLDGLLFQGFSPWWIPKLYLYLPLWAMFMIISKINLPNNAKVPVYAAISALHGILFGILWAPAQAVMFGLNWDGMVAWWLAGVPFDIKHAVGNLSAGVLIVPFVNLLQRLNKTANIE